MVDKRLHENFNTSLIEGAVIENLEEGKMNKIQGREREMKSL